MAKSSVSELNAAARRLENLTAKIENLTPQVKAARDALVVAWAKLSPEDKGANGSTFYVPVGQLKTEVEILQSVSQ